jgi:hypothetical protein
MNLLRQLYHAFSMRERILVALFVWGLLLAWVLALAEQTGRHTRARSTNREILEAFKTQLAQAAPADDMLRRARAGVDASRTFSAARLVGQLDNIARETELASFDLSIPGTQETDLFSFHTVRLNIKRAQLPELIAFDERIKAFSPYISLAQFQIIANRRDPRYLDAVFEFTAFELKEDALQN